MVARARDDCLGPTWHPRTYGVEEAVVHHLHAAPTQAGGQDDRQPVHALCDCLEAIGPVIDGVHAGHDGQEHLRCADVAGGLFAADVLLAGLQSKAVGRAPVSVDADTYEAAGQ